MALLCNIGCALRPGVQRAPRGCGAGLRALSSSLPPTPDYNTPVNVADIKLPRRARAAWNPPAPRDGSLIQQTLKEMATDEEFQLSAKNLREVTS